MTEEQPAVWVVVFDTHYECGDAIGVGGTLDAAKSIALEHANTEALGADRLWIDWRPSGDEEHSGRINGDWGRDGWPFSYTITRHKVRAVGA